MSTDSSPVIVVGAGIAGLAAALRLQQVGQQVVVLEERERVGGLLGTKRKNDTLLEEAANGFLGNNDDGAIPLAAELGVPMAEAAPAAKKRWIYLDGRLCALPTSPVAFLRSPLLTVRGKLKLLGEPLRRPRNEDETVYDFVSRRLGDEVARNLIAPFVTGIFGGDARQLSLQAAFPRLAELDRDGGLVRGMLKRRGSGGKKGRARLAAPEAGVQALIDAVHKRLGSAVECGARVVGLEPDQSGVRVHLDGGESRRAPVVVLAAPAFVASELVAPSCPSASVLLARIPYVSIAVVHLLYDRAQIAHELDGFGFLVREGEPLDILGAVFETSLWPNRAPVGKVLLRVMLGGSREPGVLDLDDEQLVARSHRAVSGTLSISGGPEAHNLVRWPRAIPQYSLGHRGRVERAESELEDQRIVLAGNAYRGVSVNDCIAGGRRVARRVAALIAAGALMLLTACSSTAQRPSHPGDAGAGAERTGTPEPASEQAAGDVVVEVLWKQPPAALVRSRGANACRGERRPWLSVHAAGGVRNAVVVLDGQAATTEAAVLRLGDCRAWPAMVALASGHDLDVVNADRRSADVALVGPAGEKRGLPMRVLGQRVRVPDLEGGLWTVNIGADRGVGYVHAATSEQRSTVTDGRGRARFSGVKPGKHRARVIHPPVQPGGAPLAAEAVVEVVANETSKISVSLGK